MKRVAVLKVMMQHRLWLRLQNYENWLQKEELLKFWFHYVVLQIQ